MRDAHKHSKKSQRGSRNVGSYNRPRVICHDRENMSLHPALYGETPVVVEPDSRLKMLLRNDPARLDWISDGRSRDPTQRMIEYAREFVRQESARLHMPKLDRKARGKAGSRDWIDRLNERELFEEVRRLRGLRYWPGDHRNGGHDHYPFYWRPGANGRQAPGRGQQPAWQRYNIDQGRPSGHRMRNVNMQGPWDIPPPQSDGNVIYLSGGTCEIGERGGPSRRVHGVPISADYQPNLRSRGHKPHRDRFQHGPYGRHGAEHIPRTRPGFYADFDPLDDDDIPIFTPGYPVGREYYDEDDAEDDTRTQYTTQSYVRSPNIVLVKPPPRYNGRHEPDTDNEYDDDEARERFGFMDRRRSPYGMGQEGGRFGTRRRGYEDEDLYRDDEDDDHFLI